MKEVARDKSSGAVLNKSKAEYQQHLASRNRIMQQKQLAKDVETLKTDIHGIKGDMKEVLEISRKFLTFMEQPK